MKLSIYRRADGRNAWRLVADNGDIVATDGSQGYERAIDAHRMAVKVINDDVLTDIEMFPGDPLDGATVEAPEPSDTRDVDYLLQCLVTFLDDRVFRTNRDAVDAMRQAAADLGLFVGDRRPMEVGFYFPVRTELAHDATIVAYVDVTDREGGTLTTVEAPETHAHKAAE